MLQNMITVLSRLWGPYLTKFYPYSFEIFYLNVTLKVGLYINDVRLLGIKKIDTFVLTFFEAGEVDPLS